MTLQRYLTRLIWVCTLPLLLLSALLAVDRWREQRAKDEPDAEHLLQAAKRLLDDNLQARLAGLQTPGLVAAGRRPDELARTSGWRPAGTWPPSATMSR